MGNSLNEKLSAWTDDELGEFEMRRVTDELIRSEAARTRVRHYQLIGAAIRDEPDAVFEQSLSDRIMAEIDALPEEEQWDLAPTTSHAGSSETKPRSGMPWLKVLAGGAIAASVALLSLTVLRSISSHGDPEAIGQPPVASAPADTRQLAEDASPTEDAPVIASHALTPAPNAELAQPVSSPAVLPAAAEPIPPAMQGEANARLLGGYLATHAEHASRRTVLPRARIMGFDIPVDESR